MDTLKSYGFAVLVAVGGGAVGFGLLAAFLTLVHLSYGH